MTPNHFTTRLDPCPHCGTVIDSSDYIHMTAKKNDNELHVPDTEHAFVGYVYCPYKDDRGQKCGGCAVGHGKTEKSAIYNAACNWNRRAKHIPMFYILSLQKPIRSDPRYANWWKFNGEGYTNSVDGAGRFRKGEIDSNPDWMDNKHDTLAIPVEVVNELATKSWNKELDDARIVSLQSNAVLKYLLSTGESDLTSYMKAHWAKELAAERLRKTA